jgi:hypothetical protein
MEPEMTPVHGAVAALVILTAATALHLGLRRVRCRLPLLLTRRRLGHPATHPDAAVDRWVGLTLLPLAVGVWLGAAWLATQVSTALRPGAPARARGSSGSWWAR